MKDFLTNGFGGAADEELDQIVDSVVPKRPTSFTCSPSKTLPDAITIHVGDEILGNIPIGVVESIVKAVREGKTTTRPIMKQEEL